MKKYLLILLILLLSCRSPINNVKILKPINIQKNGSVRTGLDVLLEDYPNILKNKTIGLVTNHTGITRNSKNNYKIFQKSPNLFLKKIFAPEHGFFGEASAGAKINYENKNFKKVEIISLYGKNRKPTSAMLKGIDLIIYDIQDIGARFYTYISTLGMVIEAASENGIDVMVFDRPNPIGGEIIEGPILDTSFKSFIGYYPIPIRYGMTVGELTNMAVNENWLSSIPKNLTIVKMDGWKRSMYFNKTGLPWVAPSPNIPDLETAIVYPGRCLIEATNISEGRGTKRPFKQIGAPWITNTLIEKLQNINLNGVEISFTKFSPESIPGKTLKPKFKNQTCYGSSLEITDKYRYKSLETALYEIYIIKNLYKDQFQFNAKTLNKLYGDKSLSNYLNSGAKSDEISIKESVFDFLMKQRNDINRFIKKSSKYYLYD